MSPRSFFVVVAAGSAAVSFLTLAHAQEEAPAEPAVVVAADAGTADAPAAEAPPPPPPDPAKENRFSVRAAGGFQYQQIHGIPVTGARLRGGIGVQSASIAHYATISALYGSTENDLRTWDLRLGWTGDLWRYSILRFGVTAEAGYLFVRRATIDRRMYALGAGGGAHLGVDLFPFGDRNDHAVTAEARLDAYVHFGVAFVWGPSVLLGFRY